MIRWALLLVAALGAIVAAIVAVGAMLPVAHEASRSEHFDSSPQQLYDLIADTPGYRGWLHDSTPVVVVQADAPRQLVTRVADPDLPFGGTWTFAIQAADNGATVTITERGEVYNPAFRFMSRYVFGHTATMEAFLRDLRTALESSQERGESPTP